jgi:hypothetical protein
MPRRREWSEAGNTLYNTAHVRMTSTPIHLYLVDRWLYLADEALHFIDNRLPHDERGWTAIDRLTPYFGNPICAAYLYVWTKWYWKHQREELSIETTVDKLSARTQEALRKMDEELDSDA